jgi:hypothetical protein
MRYLSNIFQKTQIYKIATSKIQKLCDMWLDILYILNINNKYSDNQKKNQSII